MGNMGFGTYRTLCDSYVLPVACYGAAVWSFADYPAPQVLQNRMNRFYLGVHRFAAVAVTNIEMDSVKMQLTRWLEMARFYNCVVKMEEWRLPKVVLNWDGMSRKKGWLSDMTTVATELGLPLPLSGDFTYDLDNVHKATVHKSRLIWREDAMTKPKLCVYVEARDLAGGPVLVRLNLPRQKRSLVSKLMCGILPLEVEVGRYQGVKREQRLCRVCCKKAVETESHSLFSCKKLKYTRKKMPKKLRRSIKGLKTPQEKLSTLLRENNLKSFADYLDVLYEARQQVLYR